MTSIGSSRAREASPFLRRIGSLPVSERIARTIQHNRGVRQRLIASIERSAHVAGIPDARLRLLAERAGSIPPGLPTAAALAELSLPQLRTLAAALRARARSSPSPREGSRG